MSAHCAATFIHMSAHCAATLIHMSAHCAATLIHMSAHCAATLIHMSAHHTTMLVHVMPPYFAHTTMLLHIIYWCHIDTHIDHEPDGYCIALTHWCAAALMHFTSSHLYKSPLYRLVLQCSSSTHDSTTSTLITASYRYT